MCMKYVNATAICYANVVQEKGHAVLFETPFNELVTIKEGNVRKTVPFFVVTHINVIGTNNEDHKKENILEQGGVLDVIIRLTRRSTEEAKRVCVDLDSFSVNLSQDNVNIETACYNYLNYPRITLVDNLVLDGGPGSYVIKVLVKRNTDEKYTIQSMTGLRIV